MIDHELERAITGRYWKDCPVCKSVRIELNKEKCQSCGGEVVNCRTCGTGRRWWFRNWHGIGYRCPNCGQNPEKKLPKHEARLRKLEADAQAYDRFRRHGIHPSNPEAAWEEERRRKRRLHLYKLVTAIATRRR